MDSSMGQLAGVGMGAASAVLFALLLKGAAKCALFQPPSHPETLKALNL